MKSRLLLGLGVGSFFGAMGVAARASVDRKVMEIRPDPAPQPPTSTLGRYFYQLEMKGIPYTFLTCSLAATTKCAASLMSQPFKQIQQIKNIPQYNGPTTFLGIMQKIYHNKHSFFTGSQLNIGRSGLREYSTFFFLEQISPGLEKTLPAAWQSSESIKQVMNGTLIAAADIGLYGPLERLSNIQVTHEQRTGIKLSTRQAYQSLPSVFSLWKGSTFNMMRSCYGWISFLGLHGNAMNFLDKHGIDKSAGSLSVVGTDVAIALMNAPIMNAFGVLYNQSTGAHAILNKNVVSTAKHIYNQQGSRAFLSGTPQTFLLSLFSIVSRGWALQKIEQLHEEKKSFYQS